jgi:hypothetical protein
VRQFLALLLFSPILASAQSDSQPDRLPALGFHHLHLNSTNPDATIDFYSSSRARRRRLLQDFLR